MRCSPVVGSLQQGPDHASGEGRAPVAAVLLAALVSQWAAPAFARATGEADDTAAAPAPETSAQAASPPTREDRYWADLVRACTADAKHVRLHLPGRIVQPDHIESETAGLVFRAPHLPRHWGRITESLAGTDTLVAWNDISKVEVRNVLSPDEGATRGAIVGLVIGLPVAFALAVGEAMGNLLGGKSEYSHAGEVFLGAVALGAGVGALSNRHPNGGWVTCAACDTSMTTPATATLH